MGTLIIRFLTVVLALFVAAHLVSGINVDSLYTASIVAILLGLLNVLVRPILVLLTLPITILTLGLFVLVLNAALFWFVGSFVDGFDVDGFVPALLGTLIVSVLSWLVQKLT
jgi:putative membrane protein